MECVVCVYDKKCAVARSRKCILCTPPVAFSELRLTGRENATKIKHSGWRSEVADLIVDVFLKYPTQVSLSLFFALQELLHR